LRAEELIESPTAPDVKDSIILKSSSATVDVGDKVPQAVRMFPHFSKQLEELCVKTVTNLLEPLI
jgi:hypothetical protein